MGVAISCARTKRVLSQRGWQPVHTCWAESGSSWDKSSLSCLSGCPSYTFWMWPKAALYGGKICSWNRHVWACRVQKSSRIASAFSGSSWDSVLSVHWRGLDHMNMEVIMCRRCYWPDVASWFRQSKDYILSSYLVSASEYMCHTSLFNWIALASISSQTHTHTW